VYQDHAKGLHLALWRGDLGAQAGPVLTRIQAAAGPIDALRVLTSDASGQLRAAMERIAREGRGVLLYLHVDGGPTTDAFLARLREHLALGEAPRAPAEDALRELGTGAQILLDLGVRELRLLTNNPRKIVGLEGFGLTVTERIPLHVAPHPDREAFLASRRTALGHLLDR
jgi:3,4-dihydroxy 2-butanone 4-phosphate synthase/GTP cyclohydrolase II